MRYCKGQGKDREKDAEVPKYESTVWKGTDLRYGTAKLILSPGRTD